LGLLPVHTPAWQVSVSVQGFSSSHDAPSGAGVQALVDTLGTQTLHPFNGSDAPTSYVAPPM
jgi:hypothetical protein